MDLSVTIEGLDKLEGATAAIRQSVADEINKALYVCAQKVEEEAKKSILDGNKSGRTYKRGDIGGRIIGSKIRFIGGRFVDNGSIKAGVRGNTFHRASAPGEAPASDTGRLVNSIKAKLSTSGGEATVSAGSGAVKYARWLEFGTSIGSDLSRGIAPRPYLFPALEMSRAWINARLQDAIKIALSSSRF